MTLAIDFDGTLHDTSNVPPGKKMGAPIPGAVAAMKQLRSAGHKLIIHSYWAKEPRMVQAIKSWLDYFGIPYDDITNIKPLADWYIDDKGLHFDNWENVLRKVSSK